MKLVNADCIEAMKQMPDNSVDSIVTDPPYELGFMGKSWDASGIAFNVEVWQEALRVLKPGGHLLAFSGSRTYHRMAVAIEDAGFQIRDQIMWIYGSGFPKSLDISKAIDKVNGEVGRLLKFTNWMRTTGITAKQLNEVTGTAMGGHYLTTASQPAIPTVELWAKIRPLIVDVPDWVDELVQRIEAEREVIGTKMSGIANAEEGQRHTIGASKAVEVDITAPATQEAQTWAGWGTALKPAHEPIVVARKPIEGTVAANVLTWGVGGLNIDGSRVGNKRDSEQKQGSYSGSEVEIVGQREGGKIYPENLGRWPANVIHDGSDEVVELFPYTKSGIAKRGNSGGNNFGSITPKPPLDDIGYADFGSAARFFYCAKASKRDRNEGLEELPNRIKLTQMRSANGTGDKNFEGGFTDTIQKNHHPTVKPTDLMRYLCRLVTPPAGIVLDPFMGSGSTGKAATLEGFDFIGIEQDADYVAIAEARIAAVTE